MKSIDKANLSGVQMNDTHTYFDLHHQSQSKRIIDELRKYLVKLTYNYKIKALCS